jgi:hypothetical protein
MGPDARVQPVPAGTKPKCETGTVEERMDCKKESNLARCTCTYEPCSRKGVCCDCVSYHLRSQELPACAFPNDAERTYDRSFAHFARLVQKGRV